MVAQANKGAMPVLAQSVGFQQEQGGAVSWNQDARAFCVVLQNDKTHAQKALYSL
jgi:hypothetical protein